MILEDINISGNVMHRKGLLNGRMHLQSIAWNRKTKALMSAGYFSVPKLCIDPCSCPRLSVNKTAHLTRPLLRIKEMLIFLSISVFRMTRFKNCTGYC